MLSCVICVAPAWPDDDDKPKLKILQAVDSPDPFSPNRDGTKDSATIHLEVAIFKELGRNRVLEVTTVIQSSAGKRIRKLETRLPLLEADEDEGAGEEGDNDKDKEKDKVKDNDKDNDKDEDSDRDKDGDREDKRRPRLVVSLDQVWDGLDTKGQLAADGIYAYKVKARILKLKKKNDEETGEAKGVKGTITLDTTPPRISALVTPSPNAAGWNKTDVAVRFECVDQLAGVAECPTAQPFTAEGANQLVTGTATDRAGNSKSTTTTVNIDKTPPVVAITAPLEGTTFRTARVPVTGTGTDANPIALVLVNGSPAALSNGDFSAEVTFAEGNRTISAEAQDIADNPGTAQVAIVVSIPPVMTITSPANLSAFRASPITVSGTADDPQATITVNGIPATKSAGSFTATGVPLREGPNIITAVGTDLQGNAGTASITVLLDTTPPRVTIDSPPDGFITNDASITVAGMINDIVQGTVNGEQAQVTVNGVAAQVANRAFLAANVPLAAGANTITATGKDRGGNTASTSITVTRDVAAGNRINLISGNNQAGLIGQPLPEPLVVTLTDAASNPIPNKTVAFGVTENNGTLSTGTGTGTRALAVTTDAQGRAQARWTLGMRAGAGNNLVEATAVGFAGTAMFTATALQGTPNKINVDAGSGQVGVVGQPLPRPFVAVVTDAGHNRLGNVPVTFTVKQGGGSFNGQPSLMLNTDSDGRAVAVLTLGLQEGIDNNLVEANFPNNPGFPASFTASGLAAGDPAATRISGVVLDNSDIPIQGVTLRIHGTPIAVPSDAQGQFVIQPAPVGHVLLIADGSTAQRPGVWPTLEYDLVTVVGQNNTIGMPVYLLPLDIPHGVLVDETHGGTLTLPEVPGFSLTLVPGSVTFPDGGKKGLVTVTVVHADKIPMVPNFGQQPRFIVTINPAGAHFNPPAPITIPNVDGLAPGEITELYSFDHDIGSFVAIGTGHVSEDGTIIQSDPGVGIIKGGWHCGGNPAPTGSCCSCEKCRTCQNNDCVPDPVQEAQSCGGSPGLNTSCVSGTCVSGVCVEHDRRTREEPCDDNIFCTERDRCFASGCSGDKVPDGLASSGSFALDLSPVLGGIEKVFSILGANVDLNVTFSAELQDTPKCCEQKKQRDVPERETTFKLDFELIAENVTLPNISVRIPPPPARPLVQIGFFADFGISGGATLNGTHNLCTMSGCWGGGLSGGGSIALKAGGIVGPPDDPVVSAFASGTTGLEASGTSGCASLEFVVSWTGVTVSISVELFGGFTFTASQQLIPPANLAEGELPLPLFL